LSSRKPKSKPAPKPKTPRKYNKKAIIALLIIAISSTLLLAPALYYGNFTLQIAKLVFAETTAVGEPNPFTSGAIIRVEPRSVYDYTFSIETAGIFRTNDTSVSTAQGTASITIKISITTPSAQKTVFGSSITGGVGVRSHTIYLGPSEGVRAPGLYTAIATITSTVTPTNGPAQSGSATIQNVFQVPVS